MVGRLTICMFVPQVCKAILKEFQQEYLVCPTDPEDWKKIEERLETDGMSPMQSVHYMENTLLSRSPRSQAVNISTTRVTSPLYFWL